MPTKKSPKCRIDSHVPTDDGYSCRCGYFINKSADSENQKDGLYPISSPQEDWRETISQLENRRLVNPERLVNKIKSLLTSERELVLSVVMNEFQYHNTLSPDSFNALVRAKLPKI